MKKIISLILIAVSLLSLVGCDALRESCDHELIEPKTLPGIAPTCTDSGLTEGKQCRLCGEMLLLQEEISPLGHIFVYEDDGSVENRTNKAHCTREGCGIEKTATDKERLIDEWRSASGIYYGDIEIEIPYLACSLSDSGRGPLKLKITDENIYNRDRMCDKVEYTSMLDLEYLENRHFFYTKEMAVVKAKEVFDDINGKSNFYGCYKIESNFGIIGGFDKILVYKSNDCFYFFCFYVYDDLEDVYIIHSSNFREECE